MHTIGHACCLSGAHCSLLFRSHSNSIVPLAFSLALCWLLCPRFLHTLAHNSQVVQLPAGLGQLQSLRGLFLVDMYELITLPKSFSQLTSLTTLSIQNCTKFVRLPEHVAPLTCMTSLVLYGQCSANLPPCVQMWPLRNLELSGTDDTVDTAVLPWLLPSLASTLQNLSLDRGSMSSSNMTAYMNTFPMMPKLDALRLRLNVNPDTDYDVDHMLPPLANMPALQYLDGFRRIDANLPGLLPNLRHLRLFLQGRLAVDLAAMTKMLRLEIVGMWVDDAICERFDNWLNADTFPQLQELLISDFEGISHLPKSIAKFTSLRELSVCNVRFWEESYDIGLLIDADIMRMHSLHTLNIVACDVFSLPDFDLPSLQVLRISSCPQLHTLTQLRASALPKIKDLQLNNLSRCLVLPETLGELATLQGLYITRCPRKMITIPTSLQLLTNLRELSVSSRGDTTASHTRLLSEVAVCLPGLCKLRKLCLFCKEKSPADAQRDTIAIGLALKAYPLPLLDIRDVTFPNLGLSNQHCLPMFTKKDCSTLMLLRNKWMLEESEVNNEPPAPYAFGKQWRALGLPPEAETWNDHQILVHWRTMQQKILAFACGMHTRMGDQSAHRDLSNNLMLMLGDQVSGTDTFRTYHKQRARERVAELKAMDLRIIHKFEEQLEVVDEVNEEIDHNVQQDRVLLQRQLAALLQQQKNATVARENAANEHVVANIAAEAARVAADTAAHHQISNTIMQHEQWEEERQHIRMQTHQRLRDHITLLNR